MYLFFNFFLLLIISSVQAVSDEFIPGRYLINTSKCTIPELAPFSPFLNFERNATIRCTDYSPLLTYTTVENGIPKLHMDKDAVKQYYGSTDSITCCYRYVYRNGSNWLPDVGVAFSHCKEFSDTVELTHSLVWVECRKPDPEQLYLVNSIFTKPVYENVHQIIMTTDKVKQKGEKLKKSTTRKPISVLMIVIDSVSRLNFIRTMPGTRKFVIDNDFFEFKGYNKVADNTFPNAMAFLAGLDLKQANEICKPTEIDGLNNCPFIWSQYSDLGYTTAYAEDWSTLATFNYFKRGFKNEPTDYYFKPYTDVLSYYLSLVWQDTMPFCAGPESQGDRILNLARDFAHRLKDLPTFGVFWMNTFSHNAISAPLSMDMNVNQFFESIKMHGVLNESIVILLSDHGVRYGNINFTPRGFYELRLPMHYVSLPLWFKESYPTETRNFRENTEKLTSNYDLYMTLQHVLQLSGLNYSSVQSKGCTHCRSLFDTIPKERNCAEAGIPFKWCTCNVNDTTRYL